MIMDYLWDCPNCSKAEKPRFNTIIESCYDDFDFRTQTTYYQCTRCNWLYKRVYSAKTGITIDYEITFDEKGEVIQKEVQRF